MVAASLIFCLTGRIRAIPHKSARESDERFFVRKRWKTAGILCVFQGFPNEFLAEKIRQNPQTHLRGVALEFQHQTAGERAAVQYLMGFLNFCLGEGAEDMRLDFALVEHGEDLLPQQL